MLPLQACCYHEVVVQKVCHFLIVIEKVFYFFLPYHLQLSVFRPLAKTDAEDFIKGNFV